MNQNQQNNSSYSQFLEIMRGEPQAWASLMGGRSNPDIMGGVLFYQTQEGVLVVTEVTGLPVSREPCRKSIFAFHIHEGDNCAGTAAEPFANVGTHYNPQGCPHPYHAGDLPPLFGTADGKAFSVTLSDRFTLQEAIGKTLIIHAMLDDFTSQPSGNAGVKIACGVIRRYGPQ